MRGPGNRQREIKPRAGSKKGIVTFARTHRLGLRARVTLSFAIGSMLVSILLAVSTYYLTRSSLVSQRENQALTVAFANAKSVNRILAQEAESIRLGEADFDEQLGNLPSPDGSSLLVRFEKTYYSENPVDTPQQLVLPLLNETIEGNAAIQRYNRRGEPILVVGIPLPDNDAQFFNVVKLASLADSLQRLQLILAGSAILTTLAGAVVGSWNSRRVLSPLADVSRAAEAIANDQLETRLAEVRDDPDLYPLVNSFNGMAEALQDRIERDARFASDVSHELRSPLMTLSASIEVLQKRREEMPEKAQTALDLLVDDVDRFQRLVADLLEISRFDAGVARLDLSPLLASEFLRAAAQDVGAGHVPVVTASPELEDLVILADKRRMMQVVQNLIENAGKYGGGATAITLDLLDESVEIGIEDDGPGVPEDERDIIFDRFSRGSGAGRRGADSGTGLGLSLVEEHVALHGGSVRVESRSPDAVGARFVVSLPMNDENAEPEEDLSEVSGTDHLMEPAR